MSKLILIISIVTSFLSSTIFASDDFFEYEFTQSAVAANAVTGLGLASVGFGLIGKSIGEPAGIKIAKFGGKVTGVGAASYAIIALLPSGTKVIKTSDYRLFYKKLKRIHKSILATGPLPNQTAQRNYKIVLDNFNCSWCSTDEEVLRTFSAIFMKLDKLAERAVKEGDFTHKKSATIFETPKMQDAIAKILAEDENPANHRFAQYTIKYALVYHLTNLNK